MQEGSYIWSQLERQHSPVDKWIDGIWLILLLLVAILLFSINLGEVPLQDGDEGMVALVAKEVWRSPVGSLNWLYPTVAGETYNNIHPPLIHWLVAWAYAWGGVNEWTTRFPSSIVTACSVPLLYCIGREIFHLRWPAIYSALIYLTMLPIVRYGRLAVGDGIAVTLLMVMVLCVLRSRRNLRYCLGIGISFGLIILTKGVIAIIPGVIAVVFLYWDTPRLLTTSYLWKGVLIGFSPVLAWYTGQFINYSDSVFHITNINLSDQLSHLDEVVQKQSQPSWFYLIEIFTWTWPWLIFLPQSLRFSWEHRMFSWAKLIIVWASVYIVLISLVSSKQPWYLLPIYPSLALACGCYVTQIDNVDFFFSYPRAWVMSLAALAVLASAGSIYFSLGSIGNTDLQIIFAVVALTMTLAAILAERGDRQFVRVLVWGSYLSLLLFINSNYWTWQPGQAYQVKPVAAMITRANPTAKRIYTSFPYHRSSLDFYSDRQVIPASVRDLKYYWQYHEQPYFLIDNSSLDNLKFQSVQVIDQAAGWQLITKATDYSG
jgi:4-amino-4-deoxy-L-arabinose transferase-like glycosyltransferase